MCSLSIERPRRIFRGSSKSSSGPAPRLRPALLAGLAVATLGAAALLIASPLDLFGRAAPLSGTLQAAPEQVAVVDGETLLLHRTVVRLLGITAPPRGRSCGGANVAANTDCGGASAAALAELVRGRNVSCQLNGRDPKGLAQGTCEAAGTQLNRALVASGWARASDISSDFWIDEAQARSAHRGLWSSGSL
jgi:endonuclease YncB( thermonuclease family)